MPIEIYDAMLRHAIESMVLVAGLGILLVTPASMFSCARAWPHGDMYEEEAEPATSTMLSMACLSIAS